MPKLYDQEVPSPIEPREHSIRPAYTRPRYPFPALQVNDFFIVEPDEVTRVRKAMYEWTRTQRSSGGRKFSVRPAGKESSVWVCRRVR